MDRHTTDCQVLHYARKGGIYVLCIKFLYAGKCSIVQGVAAAQAGVSVIQINMGRLQDWYNSHPGVIRDPQVKIREGKILSDTDYCYFEFGTLDTKYM